MISSTAKILTASNSRIQGLDELRGIAIITVLIHHMNWVLGDYQLGGPAVDLFLIISGFLIGRILIASKNQKNYYKRFYGRRLFRIGPLALATITGCFVLSKFLGWNTHSLPYYLCFVQNYIPVQDVVGNHPDWRGGLAGADPLWSLAVEEHFYLVIPFFIKKLRENHLLIFCFALSILSIYFKNNFIAHQNPDTFYTNPFRTETRAIYLFAGLMLNFHRWRYYYLAAVVIYWAILRNGMCIQAGRLEIIVFMLLFVIVDLTIHQKFKLRCAWLAWSGRLCFSLYLVHMPISLTLKNLEFSNTFIILGVYFVLVFTFATLSFYLFEEPIRRWGYQKIN